MELKMLRLKQFERQKIQTCKRQFGKPSKPQWKSIKFDFFFFFFKLSFFDCDRFLVIFLLFREGISIICISTGKIQSNCLSCMPICTERHMDTYQSLQQQNQAIIIRKVVAVSHFSLINISCLYNQTTEALTMCLLLNYFSSFESKPN